MLKGMKNFIGQLKMYASAIRVLSKGYLSNLSFASNKIERKF